MEIGVGLVVGEGEDLDGLVVEEGPYAGYPEGDGDVAQ